MLKLSASVTFMWRELDLVQRFAAAREAGFVGVELQSLEGADPAVLARAASEAGVAVALLNLPMGDLMQGGVGLSGVPGRREAFELALTQGLAAAVHLDCRQIHIGPSRVPAGVSREACLAALREHLDLALPRCADAGVTLLLEPVNNRDIPDALVDSLALGAELVQAYRGSGLRLQFDAYHAAAMALDPVASFRQYLPLIGHIQFSDYPGRHEPGTGQTDFPGLFAAIEHSTYGGWTGAEYMPQGPTADGLGWLSGRGASAAS